MAKQKVSIVRTSQDDSYVEKLIEGWLQSDATLLHAGYERAEWTLMFQWEEEEV